MASIIKTASGYRAQVYIKGLRESASFRTRREAAAWASARETALRERVNAETSMLHSLRDAMERYAAEVSPTKRGSRWEEIRIRKLLADPSFPVGKIGELRTEDFARWRDASLQKLSPSSVIREIGLVSAILEHARREWRWIEANPLRDMRKPRAPQHRDVTYSRLQIKAILKATGYSPSLPVRSVAQSVAVCFLLALRTGMRAGELCALRWDQVMWNYCARVGTKTVPRDVPLSAPARRLVDKMRGFDPVLVFGLKAASLDAMFRKYRDRAGVSGMTFHDTRHTAATWLAQRLHAHDLCKVFGWSNLSQSLVYYNPTASDIASRLTPQAPGRSR
jgi:integrase